MTGIFISRLYGSYIPWRGQLVNVSGDYISPELVAALFFGLYESAEFRFCQKYIKAGWNVLELGAGIGAMSAALRKIIGKDGWLRVVEANPALLDNIRRTLAANFSPDDQTEIIWAAVDYTLSAEMISFELGPSHIQSRVGYGEQAISVKRSTLKDLLKTSPSGGLCLVADVEGAEAGFILRDGQNLRRFDWIIAELHDTVFCERSVTVADMILYCEKLGFRLIERYGNVVALNRAV